MLCISSFVSCCLSPPLPWLPLLLTTVWEADRQMVTARVEGLITGKRTLLYAQPPPPPHTHILVFPRTSGRVPPTLFTPEAYNECTALNEEQELSVQFHDSSYLHPWAYKQELKKWGTIVICSDLFWCHTAYTPVPLASYCVPMHKLFTYTQAHLCMNRHPKFALASTVI